MQELIRSVASVGSASPQLEQGRLMVRLIAEMQMTIITAGVRALHGDLDRAIIFMAIARISDMLPNEPLGDAQTERRANHGISINALAASLGRPFETMRRHIHTLCDLGLCVRGDGGFTIPHHVQTRPEIASLFRTSHDAMVRLVDDMADFGFTLPETRAHRPYRWRTGLAAAHDVLLTGVEFHAHQFQSWTDMVLATGIMCANSRPFTYDRAISMAYADFAHLPPDTLRMPVSTGAVARALGLPASTAHRRVAAMVESGVLVRRQRGVMMTDAVLNDPARIEDSRTAMLHTRQILMRLAAGGFRFADPASCYLDGRPALVQFG